MTTAMSSPRARRRCSSARTARPSSSSRTPAPRCARSDLHQQEAFLDGSLLNILIYAGIILFGLIVIGLILTRLYRRATKDVALIRTGFGGEKVVLNGGIMVIPVLHELMQVRLTTVKL